MQNNGRFLGRLLTFVAVYYRPKALNAVKQNGIPLL